MRVSREKIVRLIILLSTAMLLAGCGTGSGFSRNEGLTGSVKIGFLAPLSGSMSTYGNAVNSGVQLAVDEINEAGGIDGNRLELIAYDTKGQAVEAVKYYNRLTDRDQVAALIGGVTNEPALAVAQRAAEDGLPMIIPSASATELTELGDNIFRLCSTDAEQGTAMADFAADNLSAGTAAVFSNIDSSYSAALAEAFKVRAQDRNTTIVAELTYSEDERDFLAQLTTIAQAQPDVVYMPDYALTSILLLRQADEIGLNVPILGGDAFEGLLGETRDSFPYEADGVFFTGHAAMTDEQEAMSVFIENYQQAYETEPLTLSALGYDAVSVLAAALETAGSTDSETLVRTLKDIHYEGLAGGKSFDRQNNTTKDLYILTISNAAYEFVCRMPNDTQD